MNNYRQIIKDVFTGIMYFIIVYLLFSIISGLIVSFIRFDLTFLKYGVLVFLMPDNYMFEILRYRIFILIMCLLFTVRFFITTEKK